MKLFNLLNGLKNRYQGLTFSFFASFFLTCFASYSQTTETFTSSGSFLVPCGVTSITVAVYGGGGGGGGSNTGGSAGGGGGAGGYATTTFTVTAGNTFAYVVGTGGVGGGPGLNGSGGMSSSWDGGTVSANGGSGGFGDNNGGGGGAGGAGIGTTTATGGAGANGTATIGGFGGTAGGPDGGSGGPGGAPGINGGTPTQFGGGGGGGGDKNAGSNTSGGIGASGGVVVTYTSTITAPLAGNDQNACGALSLAGNTPDAGWIATWSVVSGSATIASPNSPTSGISGIAAGSCATLRWTFTQVGCPDQTEDVIICVPIICNDEPCIATPLAVGTSCSYSSFNSTGSTISSGMYEPGCASFSATLSEDVWFSAVIPANGVLEIQARDDAGVAGAYYPGIAIYSGPCGDLMHQGCDQTTSTITPSNLVYTGTPGETVYIRVWSYTDGVGGFELCAFTHANATGTILTGSTTATCGGTETFMDPGGTGDYVNEMTGFWTICPDIPGEFVSINFTTFALENGFDFLTVMDGGNGSSPIIGNYTGATNPGTITSSAADGCLSFSFRSDVTGVAAGWTADVTCTSTAGTNTIICTTTNCPGDCGIWVCSDGLYPTDNQGSSSVEEITYQSSGCWSGAAGEISTSWFYFTALTNGTIEMTFDGPAGQDYDFAVWGPSLDGIPPCPSNTGDSPIRCSYSGAANPVGIGGGAVDLYEDASGDGWVAPLNVIAGETYVLGFNIFQNGNPQPVIDVTFGGTGTLDCIPVFLAISLESFKAINQGSKNHISWVTTTEMNNEYFTVERSISGLNWEEVGRVVGAGNSDKPLFYSIEDYGLFYPVTYYRLKQTDIDGEFSYSEVISVNAERDEGMNMVSPLFPNPANEYSTFSYVGDQHHLPLSVVVTDPTGTTVAAYNYENIAPDFSATIITKDFGSGTYHVSFKQGYESTIQKLVVLRK